MLRFLATTILVGWGFTTAIALDLTDLPSPAGPGSGEPNLIVGDTSTYLTWVEPVDEGDALRFSVWDGDAWSAARTIATGHDWFVNWADFPSLVELADGTLAAHWLQQEGEATYAYGVRMVFSTDQGETWSAPMTPHTDGTLTEHGFVSMVPWSDDGVMVVWLDGRNYVDTVSASGDTTHATKEMQLRAAHFSSRGERRGEWVIDEKVCDCCQTTAVRVGESIVVAYRDRDDDEIRDVYHSRFDGAAWSAPVPVAVEGWEIPGCPVNGPRADVQDDHVVMGWYAAANGVGTVSIAISSDGGESFGAPIRVDEGEPLGRVDVTWLAGGDGLVSWMESDEEGNALLKTRRFSRDGSLLAPLVFAESSAARASGFPQLARQGDTVLFAWRMTGEPAAVHVARGDVR